MWITPGGSEGTSHLSNSSHADVADRAQTRMASGPTWPRWGPRTSALRTSRGPDWRTRRPETLSPGGQQNTRWWWCPAVAASSGEVARLPRPSWSFGPRRLWPLDTVRGQPLWSPVVRPSLPTSSRWSATGPLTGTNKPRTPSSATSRSHTTAPVRYRGTRPDTANAVYEIENIINMYIKSGFWVQWVRLISQIHSLVIQTL